MPQSKVSIWNIGLSHIGQGEIADFNESSESARLARLRWDPLLDAVLVEMPWNFATARASAAAGSTAPLWRWTAAYPLDPLCLRVLELEGDDDADWEIEDVAGITSVVTDLGSPINYRYIKRVIDPARFSPLFVEALAARIAIECAESITRDQAIIRNMVELYNTKLKLARQVDSQEKTPVQIDASTWIRARSQGLVALAKLSGGSQPLGYP